MAITYKRMSYEDRVKIKEMLQAGNSAIRIAREIGVHKSTIYRELERGGGKDSYEPVSKAKESTSFKVIRSWIFSHPDGTKAECIRETGLSRPTVYKYWKAILNSSEICMKEKE